MGLQRHPESGPYKLYQMVHQGAPYCLFTARYFLNLYCIYNVFIAQISIFTFLKIQQQYPAQNKNARIAV